MLEYQEDIAQEWIGKGGEGWCRGGMVQTGKLVAYFEHPIVMSEVQCHPELVWCYDSRAPCVVLKHEPVFTRALVGAISVDTVLVTVAPLLALIFVWGDGVQDIVNWLTEYVLWTKASVQAIIVNGNDDCNTGRITESNTFCSVPVTINILKACSIPSTYLCNSTFKQEIIYLPMHVRVSLETCFPGGQ